MARDNSRSLADLAVSILSELPPSVEMFSADGGVVTMTIQGQQGSYVAAQGPRLRVRPQLQLTLRTNDSSGGGHDIVMTVAEIHQAGEWMADVNLRVLDVRRRETHRMAPRARVDDMALVHVLGARAIAGGEEFDVRLADLSANGVAFVTDQSFHAGDLVAMMITVGGGVLRLRGRVLQTTSSHYGRQRVGCEITQISDTDRRRISQLTEERPATGSVDQRLHPAG